MVKIHMNGHDANITFTGKPVSVAMEVAAAISGIYQGIYANSTKDAAVFRGVIQASMKHDSPVWSREHDITVVTIETKISGAPTDQS